MALRSAAAVFHDCGRQWVDAQFHHFGRAGPPPLHRGRPTRRNRDGAVLRAPLTLSDDEVRAVLGDKFPKHIYHSIICIGALAPGRRSLDRDGAWRPAYWGATREGTHLIVCGPDRRTLAATGHVQRFVVRPARPPISCVDPQCHGSRPFSAALLQPLHRRCGRSLLSSFNSQSKATRTSYAG
jgi:hypothetical protein